MTALADQALKCNEKATKVSSCAVLNVKSVCKNFERVTFRGGGRNSQNNFKIKILPM